jgi:cell cycle sensor histidine kinase DivJ
MLDKLRSLFTPKDLAVWDGGAGNCVLLVGRDGRIAALSDGAPAILARSRAAAVGERLAAMFGPAHEPDIERALRISGKTFATAENGRRFEISARERANGKKSVLIVEMTLEKSAPVAASASEHETAELLADLSHEMRTPLNAVIGFADAMINETFGPLGHDKYAEYASHIRTSGAHLLDLVNSILDLAKIEAERFELRRELVDAGRLVRECAGIMRLAVEEAGLTLAVDAGEDLPECWIDPRAVRQILLNLLSNAVKFTSDGGVTLSARSDGGDLVLTVSDTGVGMSASELARLGDRFTSAREAGVRGAKGAGLGLSLAFALAELHGGQMKLQSAPGEGMTARVRLPVRAPATPARQLRLAMADATRINRPQSSILTQLERIEAYRRERATAA